MALSMLLAAALAAQAEPPPQSGPRPGFIICPGNPRCPRTPREQNRPQAPVDQAPPAYAIARPDPASPGTDRVVYFESGATNLGPAARAVLDGLAQFLIANPPLSVSIEGHTDERGSREANLALAARRAEAVRDYLISLGIRADRLTTVSYGEERPALYDSGESVWMMNRRVEIKIR